VLAILLAAAASCPAPTPEDALRRIEDAYRKRDIEAVIACKDFRREAQLMVAGLDRRELKDDPAVVTRLAETLESAFRQQLRSGGFPEMNGVTCRVVEKVPGSSGDIVVATEQCVFPDGGKSVQRIQVAKVGKDWRVLVPVHQ